MLEQIQYIDLFSGIGGFHQALNNFNAKCVFASDWDKEASKTYHENYGIKPHGNITKIDEKEIPPHDLLCAGFPCQSFSISGNQKGFGDTRGTLFFEIARIIKFHRPKVILLENVRNFEKHNHGKTLRTVVETLEKLNYDVYHKVLNASNYGLPQNRERIFIVCFRHDLSIYDFEFPKPTNEQVSLFDILETDPCHAKYIDRPDTVFTKTFEPQTNLFGEVSLPNKPIQNRICEQRGTRRADI